MASPSYLDKINAYYQNYPDFTKFIDESTDTSPSTTVEKGIRDLQVTEPSRAEAIQKEFLYIGGPEVIHAGRKKKDQP